MYLSLHENTFQFPVCFRFSRNVDPDLFVLLNIIALFPFFIKKLRTPFSFLQSVTILAMLIYCSYL